MKKEEKKGTLEGQVITNEEWRKRTLDNFRNLWKYGHAMFYDLIIQMCEIHEVKNKSYGIGSSLGNFMECERFNIPAWKGCLVRMSDKVSRIYNLTSKIRDPEYADAFEMENLEDTFLDLANYSLLCLILLREEKKKSIFKKILKKGTEENTACESMAP